MQTKSRSSQSGITLIELLIAMLLFFIVTGAIWGLMRVGTIDKNRASRRSDALKNARASLQLIGRDAANAGLGYQNNAVTVPDDFLSGTLGFPVDGDNVRDRLTAIVNGDDVNTNNLSGVRTDMVAFVFQNESFFTSRFITATSTSNTSSSTATISTLAFSNDIARTYDILVAEEAATAGVRAAVMVTSNPGTTSTTLAFATNDPLGINQPANGSGESASILRGCTVAITDHCMDNPAIYKRIFLVTYKVLADGTFVRTSYGNNRGMPAAQQIVEQPLAFGVRNMQISYVLRDGTAVVNPTEAQRASVRQVNVTLTVQGDGVDEATRQPNVVTLTGSYRLRNLEY